METYLFDVLLLQSYAKQQNDAKLMVDVMKLLKANDMPLQPGTADIIFRYINQRLSYFLIIGRAYKFIMLPNLYAC